MKTPLEVYDKGVLVGTVKDGTTLNAIKAVLMSDDVEAKAIAIFFDSVTQGLPMSETVKRVDNHFNSCPGYEGTTKGFLLWLADCILQGRGEDND